MSNHCEKIHKLENDNDNHYQLEYSKKTQTSSESIRQISNKYFKS